jgi:predicted cobalt transporter CbtA
MDVSMAWICASVIVSSIGFVLLHYGRKLARPPQAVVGLLMLVYPYFVPGVLPMAIVAAALLLLLWLAVRLGW